MKYLFVGGSFDPIHNGHLIAARECAEQIGADRVVLVPSAMKAHKGGKSPFETRYKMCQQAVDGDKFFTVSEVEQNVLAAKGDSYTYAVMEEILDRLRRQVEPTAERINWMIGADTITKAFRWGRQDRLKVVANFVIAHRPGYELDTTPLSKAGHSFTVCNTAEINISSTDIRERIRAGKPIRYLVPPSVEGSCYQLYGGSK